MTSRESQKHVTYVKFSSYLHHECKFLKDPFQIQKSFFFYFGSWAPPPTPLLSAQLSHPFSPSLLNKVPWLSECLSAQVTKCLWGAWVPKCLRGHVPNCLECPSALRVPKCLKCPSAQAPWVLECSSTLRVPECLECLECLQSLECLKCSSASVSQLVSQQVIQLVYKAG